MECELKVTEADPHPDVNVLPTGPVLLPAHEVPVLLLAGGVRGQLGRVRAVLLLHRAVSWARVQKLNSERFIFLLRSHPITAAPERYIITSVCSVTNTRKA